MIRNSQKNRQRRSAGGQIDRQTDKTGGIQMTRHKWDLGYLQDQDHTRRPLAVDGLGHVICFSRLLSRNIVVSMWYGRSSTASENTVLSISMSSSFRDQGWGLEVGDVLRVWMCFCFFTCVVVVFCRCNITVFCGHNCDVEPLSLSFSLSLWCVMRAGMCLCELYRCCVWW